MPTASVQQLKLQQYDSRIACRSRTARAMDGFAASTCDARGVSLGGCPCCVEIASGGVQLQHARMRARAHVHDPLAVFGRLTVHPVGRSARTIQGCAAMATCSAFRVRWPHRGNHHPIS